MPRTRKPGGKAVGHRNNRVVALVANVVEPPAPPTGLLKATRDRWAAFWSSDVAMAVSVKSDLPRLERWIKATDEYDRVSKVFRSARLVQGSTGQVVLNPLAAYLQALEAQVSKAETEFGMTPYARLRLGIAVGEAHKSLAEFNRELDEAGDDSGDADRFTFGPVIDADSAPT